MRESEGDIWSMSAREEEEIRNRITRQGCSLYAVAVVAVGLALVVVLVILGWAILSPIVEDAALVRDPPHLARRLDGFEELLDGSAPEGARLIASERDDGPSVVGDSNLPNVRRSYEVLTPADTNYGVYRAALSEAGWKIRSEEIYGPGVTARKRFDDRAATAFITQGEDTSLSATIEIGCTPIDDR